MCSAYTELEKITNATTPEITTTQKVTEAPETTTQISTLDISNDVKNLSSQVEDLESQLSKGAFLFLSMYDLLAYLIIFYTP